MFNRKKIFYCPVCEKFESMSEVINSNIMMDMLGMTQATTVRKKCRDCGTIVEHKDDRLLKLFHESVLKEKPPIEPVLGESGYFCKNKEI